MNTIMATLREIMRFMCDCAAASGHTFSDDMAAQIENQLRSQYGGDRVYIPPAGSRQDPERKEKIRAEIKRFPTGVVAARFGVSRQYVGRLARKK